MFVFILLYASLTISVRSCPSGFVAFPSDNNRCIALFEQSLSYFDVIRHCDSLGAIPAKLLNVFENSFAQSLLAHVNSNAYIGVEKGSNGTWSYADESFLSYAFWDKGEPANKSSKICAVMEVASGKSGQWKASECTSGLPYFCTISSSASSTTTTTTTGRTTTTTTWTPVTTQTQDGPCQVGWKYFNDHCYYLQNFTTNDPETWATWDFFQADFNCRQMDANLISIHSDAENNFVKKELIYTNFSLNNCDDFALEVIATWIGLYSEGYGGVWTDKSVVDYSASCESSCLMLWSMTNEENCSGKSGCWLSLFGDSHPRLPRYICKKPAVKQEKLLEAPQPLSSTTAQPTSGSDWVYYPATDAYYYLQKFTYNTSFGGYNLYDFFTAEYNCRLLNGNLVSFHSTGENDFVRGLINADSPRSPNDTLDCSLASVWIGLFAFDEWTDGTSVNTDMCCYDCDCNLLGTISVNPDCNRAFDDCSNNTWRGIDIHSRLPRYVCKRPASSTPRLDARATNGKREKRRKVVKKPKTIH